MQTLTATGFGLHQVEAACVSRPAERLQARKKIAPGRKRKNKRRRDLTVKREEDGPGRRPHFQTARITPFSDRR
jgi:hypothetical protein